MININKTLEVARELDAAILPAPDKAYIYKYKFRNILPFNVPVFAEEAPAYDALKELFSLQAPAFSHENFTNLARLRGEKRIQALREKVWSLAQHANAYDTNEPNAIRQEVEAAKNQLIDLLRPPSASQSILKVLISEFIEFPFSIFTEGYSLLNERRTIKPYQWLLLLIDLNKEASADGY